MAPGLEHLEGIARQGMTPDQYAEAVTAGLADPIRSCGTRGCSSYATWVGLVLIWIAAVLTALTGWDYFRKVAALLAGRKMIDVLYFAWVRERIGLPREKVETQAETVADLVAELMQREERYALAFADLASLRVALDQELSDFSASLAGVREVAFFPPMTGG